MEVFAYEKERNQGPQRDCLRLFSDLPLPGISKRKRSPCLMSVFH